MTVLSSSTGIGEVGGDENIDPASWCPTTGLISAERTPPFLLGLPLRGLLRVRRRSHQLEVRSRSKSDVVDGLGDSKISCMPVVGGASSA